MTEAATIDRPQVASPVHVEVVARSADISAFEPAWREFFAASSNEPSTSFEWTVGMLQHHLEPDDRFFLLRITRGGRTIGLLPVVSRAVHLLGQRLNVLAPLSERYNTHGDILGNGLDADAMAALVRTFKTLDTPWDIFRMSNLLEGTPLPDSFQAGAKEAGLDCNIRYTKPAYFLELPETFDEYMAARSAKFRQNARRARRQLEAHGTIAITRLRDEADFDAAYEALLTVERASWKQAHGTAITAVPRQTGFYRTMGRIAAAAGRLDLQTLQIDGTPVAHNFGYIHNGCYYYLKTSYDERVQACSPAMFLRAHLIESLIGRGVRCMDFHGEPYEWEARWTGTYRWHTCLTIYNGTLKGRAMRWVEHLSRAAGRRPDVKHCDPLAVEAPSR